MVGPRIISKVDIKIYLCMHQEGLLDGGDLQSYLQNVNGPFALTKQQSTSVQHTLKLRCEPAQTAE